MQSYPNFASALLVAVLLLQSGCKVVDVRTSAAPQPENNYGRYYLPRKMIECVAIYTVTYKDHYKWDLPDNYTAAQIKKAKRHYSKEPDLSKQEVWKVKVADTFAMTFPVEYDPATTYWLSSTGRLDLLDITYAANAPGIIAAVNAAYTPPGEVVATTALKVGTVLVTAAAGMAKSASFVPHQDSTATTRTEQVSIKKTVDVRQFCPKPTFTVADCKNGEKVMTIDSTHAIMSFGGADLGISNNTGIYVPAVTLYLTKSRFPQDGDIVADEEKAIQTLANKPVAGVFYRRPMLCDITVKVQRDPSQQNVSPSTLVMRTSFPQLGRIAVAPVQFRSGFLAGGKRTITVSFNTDSGGLTAYKQERTRGTGTAATEAGNLSKALLEAYGTRRQANTELQQLKDSNALMEEKIKEAENKKKLDALQLP